MDGRSMNMGQGDERFKFTGKELDVETGLDYFGARSYDARIGRWLCTDPLMEKYLSWSSYVYSLDNSINRIDPNGKWSVKVVVGEDRNATLYLFDRHGNSKGSFWAKAKGNTNNRMADEGDTPFGMYSMEGWIIPDEKQDSKNKRSYGSNPRLMLEPTEGEALEAKNKGRWGFRVHGGDLDDEGNLRSTWGCIRMSNDDMLNLYSTTQELERNDQEEKPTTLQVAAPEKMRHANKDYEMAIVPPNL
jgi:RHS repeat-associated protein